MQGMPINAKTNKNTNRKKKILKTVAAIGALGVGAYVLSKQPAVHQTSPKSKSSPKTKTSPKSKTSAKTKTSPKSKSSPKTKASPKASAKKDISLLKAAVKTTSNDYLDAFNRNMHIKIDKNKVLKLDKREQAAVDFLKSWSFMGWQVKTVVCDRELLSYLVKWHEAEQALKATGSVIILRGI